MDLQMNDKVAEEYSNKSQKIRVITENWVSQNLFCPYCGNVHICHFENNRPVADFYCPSCSEEYELKSKHTAIHNKVADGAYDTMLGRIYIVKDEKEQPVEKIVNDVKKMDFVKQYELEARGWIFDILKCVNSIGKEEFTLNQMY